MESSIRHTLDTLQIRFGELPESINSQAFGKLKPESLERLFRFALTESTLEDWLHRFRSFEQN